MRLPPPPGPHAVGCVDVTFAVPFGTAGRTCDPLADVYPPTGLARLYYPAAGAATDRCGAPWLPSPAYHAGYGSFVGAPAALASVASRLLLGSVRTWAVPGAPPAAVGARPLVVFSHGLAGMRTTYSVVCAALASAGHVVAAVEHRDGSACATEMHVRDAVALGDVHDNFDSTGSGRYVMYVHPPRDPVDAGEFRARQLGRRVAEVRGLVDALGGPDLAPSVAALLRGVRSDDGGVRYHACGHSFGGATAALLGEVDGRVLLRVLLDPWMVHARAGLCAYRSSLRSDALTDVVPQTESSNDGDTVCVPNHQSRGNVELEIDSESKDNGQLPKKINSQNSKRLDDNLSANERVCVIDTETFPFEDNTEHLNAFFQSNGTAGYTRSVIANADHMDQSDIVAAVPGWLLSLLGRRARAKNPSAILAETYAAVLSFIK